MTKIAIERGSRVFESIIFLSLSFALHRDVVILIVKILVETSVIHCNW
jgi:hypothetical protein